jgi:hypothetical protein
MHEEKLMIDDKGKGWKGRKKEGKEEGRIMGPEGAKDEWLDEEGG